ncbi:MAG: GldG family protein [Ruminococcus sp.]|nr:GldG family protein [Ruminococcus sp.]
MSDEKKILPGEQEKEIDTTAAEEVAEQTENEEMVEELAEIEETDADITVEQAVEEAVEQAAKNEEKLKKEKKAKKPKKEKKKRTHKKLKHGSLSIAFTAVFVVVLVLINVVATQLFERFPLSFDMTSNDSYSISDETIEYVESVDMDVKVTVLAEEDEFNSQNVYTLQANEILKKYAQYNSRIEIEYIDFLSNPNVVAEYDDGLSEYDIIFETTQTGDDGEEYQRTSVVSPLDLVNFASEVESSLSSSGITLETFAESYYGSQIAFITAYAGETYTDSSTNEKISYIESSNAEQAFTSALMIVTDSNPIKITLLTGREEAVSLTYYQTLMKANGYEVDSIDITTEDIPEDTDIAVIAAPTVDYTSEEVQKVSDFLNNDGELEKNLMYVASVQQPDTPNLDELLEEYGIIIEDYCMYDSDSDNVSNGYLKVNLSNEDYEEDMKDDSLVMLTTIYTQPITLKFDEDDMKQTSTLLKTDDTGYKADMETGDVVANGEQIAAAIGSKAVFYDDNTEGYSQVLVLGSEYLLDDTILQATQYANSQWILSVTNEITGKTTSGITIEPSVIGGELFELTDAQITIYKWIFIAVIPLIVLIIGVVIWIRRKNA